MHSGITRLRDELRTLEERHRTTPRPDTVAVVIEAVRARYDLVEDRTAVTGGVNASEKE